MKKTKMFMLVLTSAVLALTPVTANAAEAAPSQVTETVIATTTPVSYTHLTLPTNSRV